MYCSPILTGISSYEIRDFKVFFGNQYLPDARWSDFKDLGQGYGLSSSLSPNLFNLSNFSRIGRDGNHVFFMGRIVKDAHPFSFHVIGNTYAKDYQHVFQYGQIIENFQSHCFHPPTNEFLMTQPMNATYPMQMSMPVGGVPMPIPSYKIQDFKVFFDNEHVPDARWIDFTNLGQGYGMFLLLK
jgi:hypothetical protein